VFGILGSEAQFEHLANEMRAQLDEGRPVYVSSLGFPERNVLNHLFQRLDGSEDLAGIRALSTKAFAETFPEYELDPIAVDAANGVRIFQLVRR
jgi:hypothetical protein